MPELKDVLEKVDKLVEEYHQCDIDEPNHLNQILQDLLGNLYYLEKERAKYHDLFQTKVFYLSNHKEGKNLSVNKAENCAHFNYPELYMLRHIMKAAYEIVWGIKSRLSGIKAELRTIN